MAHRKHFRTALLAAGFALWGWAGMEARGQADAWIVSNEQSPPGGVWLNTPPNIAPVPPAISLPAPGGALGYNGVAAVNSQHIRTNGTGQLIFFEVDGNVYDGDGYLIADARAEGCSECVEPGVMEFVSVPVPGSCSLYYLLTSVPTKTTENTYVQVSVLDMASPNPYFEPIPGQACSGRMGNLISYTEELDPYPQFNNWNTYGFEDPQEYETSESVVRLLTTTYGKGISPLLRVVAGQQPNDPAWLFFILADRVYVFQITNGGIFPVQQPLTGSDDIPTYPPPGSYPIKQYFRDADATRMENGQIRLAHVDGYSLYAWPILLGAESNNLLTMRFSSSTGQLVPGSAVGYSIMEPPAGCNGGPTVNIAPGLRGCALTEDGNGLYLTGESTSDCQTWFPFVRHLDLTTGFETDLTTGVPSAITYVRSRIYRNKAPNGIGEAIYFPYATGVAALTITANPAAGVFSADVFSGTKAPLWVPLVDPGDNTYKPRFLDIAVTNDQHLSTTNMGTCCTYFETVPGALVGGHTQLPGMQPTWTAANNPLLPGTGTLVFNCDLIVETGASLALSNLTLKFINGAKVIVKRGGSLSAGGTTFTSIDCPGERWPGIRVEGTTSDGSQGLAFQGYLRLTNSNVENSLVGVWCAREGVSGQAVSGYFGGRVYGLSSNFRNCIVGTRIERYHRTGNLPNLCYFVNCTFKTDNGWPDPGVSTPKYHAHVYDVNGVKFRTCKFRNDSPGQFALLNRGWGVLGFFAGFDVLGSTVQDASLFKDLTIGVAAATGTLRKANVRRSWFRGNLIGAYMQGCTAPEISRSTFFVPEASSPNSPIGLVLHQSTAYTVEENIFNGGGIASGSIGIHWLGDMPTENQIYNNSFNQLNVGTYVRDRQQSQTTTGFLGLKLYCGDYTECGFDYYLGDNTSIKRTQGNWDGPGSPDNQLAGNRFFSGVINGISISNIQPTGPNAPFFQYRRHNVSECDPLNPSPYYSDVNITTATVFNKEEACGNGTLSAIGGGGGVVGFGLAAAQLQSAEAYFTGTVDTGEREDILDAIKQDNPWLPSHTLRDYLLARCPLSDEVLLTVIYREQAMDAWHLTQVMLGNAKLTEQVMKALETSELLNEYMLAIVYNAGSGPTVKDLLREEVELRASQKARWLSIAIDEIASDSLLINPADDIYAMLAAHPDPTDLYGLVGIAMERGDHATANAWLDNIVAAKATDTWLLRDLVAMHQVLSGQWEQADGTQREALALMATSQEPGAALAWAILYHLGETEDVPSTEMPSTEKSFRLHTERSAGSAKGRPVLEAHPNPTTGKSWAVITIDLDEAAILRVSDPQGRVVSTVSLAVGQRMAELDLSGLAIGLYTCELLQAEMKLGAVKVTVQR